jgi:tRNA-modifying protein YgfZ
MANAAILHDRAIIALEGPETRSFLQGLVTNDVAQCVAGEAVYAAILTPQGKILFDFILAATESIFFVDCAAARANDLVKRLGFYRLRAKVNITTRPELGAAAIWGETFSHGNIFSVADPRLSVLGTRLIGPVDQLEEAIGQIPAGDYEDFRLQLGVPDSADLPPDQVFALDAGMEELHGVSFSKGCYVGQEVTARMKHRSSARRRFYIAESEDIPAPGTIVDAQGKELGRITSAKNSRGLALVRLDRLAEAEENHLQLRAGGKPLSLRRPDWLHV